MSDRPVLLLDVDGVVCPLGPGPGCAMTSIDAGGCSVRVRADLPELLAALGQRCELVWCTAWGDAANAVLAPALGLAPLSVVAFDASVAGGGTWKLPHVERFVGDRPFAWVDDELGVDAHWWAEHRPHQSLLLDVDPTVGLIDRDIDTLLAWADQLTARSRRPQAKKRGYRVETGQRIR